MTAKKIAARGGSHKMSLRKTQSRFALNVAMLILEAEKRGYEVTFGDAYRDPRVHGKMGEKLGYSHPNSTHKVRLAIDLNLFSATGEYITDDTGHRELHSWWVEKCGGSPMIDGDPNHYSFEYRGVR
jgi:hypothetical protein